MTNTHTETERTVRVTTGEVSLEGTLRIPPDATAIVLFAHGSGSSRVSPRNRYVADVLNDGGLATLLVDLLTPHEEAIDERTRHIRFDIGLLGERLIGAVDWMSNEAATRSLPVGLFGASTGAAAALVAAAARPDRVHAVVSRGGRPDLADGALTHIRAPTLLIVGGADTQVIELNERARRAMMEVVSPPEVRLEIIPGATHLFEEPGALDEVALMARDWFARYLTPDTP